MRREKGGERTQSGRDSVTVSEKDDRTRTDSRYVAQTANLLTQEYAYGTLRNICRGLEREIETISRVITALELRTHSEGVHIKSQRSQRKHEPEGDPDTVRRPVRDALSRHQVARHQTAENRESRRQGRVGRERG